jgi:hypothetical protein
MANHQSVMTVGRHADLNEEIRVEGNDDENGFCRLCRLPIFLCEGKDKSYCWK